MSAASFGGDGNASDVGIVAIIMAFQNVQFRFDYCSDKVLYCTDCTVLYCTVLCCAVLYYALSGLVVLLLHF